MAEVELNSFITKFKYLCHAGFDASLNLSCAHGKATVTLQAEIGFMGPPPSQVPHTPFKRRSPAYSRRIARRQTMRQSENHAEEASPTLGLIDEDILSKAEAPTATVDNDILPETGSVNEGERAVQAQADSNVTLIEQIEEEVDEHELALDKLVDQVIVHVVPRLILGEKLLMCIL